jgi:hypothetical protein
MKKPLTLSLAAAVSLSAATAHAGGPVVIVDEPEVVAEKPASSVGILPLLLVGVVLCAALCGGSDDEPNGDVTTTGTGTGTGTGTTSTATPIF